MAEREPVKPVTPPPGGLRGPGVHADEDADTGWGGVTPRQAQAIAALLAEPTVQKAADSLGLNDRTLFRWLQDPKFAAAYRAARRNAFQQAIGLSHKYAPLAVQTLAKVMADPKAPAGAKVSAAKGLLEFSRESIEVDDLAARVDALEARARQIDDTTLVDATSFEVTATGGGSGTSSLSVSPSVPAGASSSLSSSSSKPRLARS